MHLVKGCLYCSCVCVCLLGDIEDLLDDAVEIDALEVALSFTTKRRKTSQQTMLWMVKHIHRLATHRFHLLHRVEEDHDRVEKVVLTLQTANNQG